MLYVAWKKRTSSKMCTFYPVLPYSKRVLFNLLCALDLCSAGWKKNYSLLPVCVCLSLSASFPLACHFDLISTLSGDHRALKGCSTWCHRVMGGAGGAGFSSAVSQHLLRLWLHFHWQYVPRSVHVGPCLVVNMLLSHWETLFGWDQKHTKGERERFSIRQNKTECKYFWGNPLFQSYKLYRNKPITCLLPVGFLQEELCLFQTVISVSNSNLSEMNNLSL